MKKTQTILIIDDKRDLGGLIRVVLKDQNYKVVCAFSLREGKRKWMDLKPDVILLGRDLRDGSGFSLVERNPSLLATGKVIMITADTTPDTKIRAEMAGIDHFIQKPFSLKLIRELVQEIISESDIIPVMIKTVDNRKKTIFNAVFSA